MIDVPDDDAARPHKLPRQRRVVLDRRAAMVAVDEYRVARRQIVGFEIERTALVQLQVKARVGIGPLAGLGWHFLGLPAPGKSIPLRPHHPHISPSPTTGRPAFAE